MTENRAVLHRPAPPAELVIRYGPHPDQVADVWLAPPSIGAAPVVMLWHGGFWRPDFDRTYVGSMAVVLAAAGWTVVSVEYRRPAVGGGWPVTLVDVAAAADVVPTELVRSARGRVDIGRVVYLGHSAGGQLATWAALRHRLPTGAPGRLDRPPRVRGVLALAPVLDLVEAHRLALDDDAVEAFMGGRPEDVPERYAAADPAALGAVPAGLVVVHGDQDARVPIAMSRRFQAATGATLVEVAGADHFALIDPESVHWKVVPDRLDRLVG